MIYRNQTMIFRSYWYDKLQRLRTSNTFLATSQFLSNFNIYMAKHKLLTTTEQHRKFRRVFGKVTPSKAWLWYILK